MKISKEWRIGFTSGLLATILGIVLTFGIGRMSENILKSKFVRESEILAINSINTEFDELWDVQEYLVKRMELIDSVMVLYADGQEISDDL